MSIIKLETANTAEINALISSSSLYVGYTGIRYIVYQDNYIELDHLVERALLNNSFYKAS